MWSGRENLIQRLGCPRGGFAENTTHWAEQWQPGGSKQQDTTPTPPLASKGRRAVIRAQGQGHPEKGGPMVGLDTGMLRRWRRMGGNTPFLHPPGSYQYLSLASPVGT